MSDAIIVVSDTAGTLTGTIEDVAGEPFNTTDALVAVVKAFDIDDRAVRGQAAIAVDSAFTAFAEERLAFNEAMPSEMPAVELPLPSVVVLSNSSDSQEQVELSARLLQQYAPEVDYTTAGDIGHNLQSYVANQQGGGEGDAAGLEANVQAVVGFEFLISMSVIRLPASNLQIVNLRLVSTSNGAVLNAITERGSGTESFVLNALIIRAAGRLAEGLVEKLRDNRVEPISPIMLLSLAREHLEQSSSVSVKATLMEANDQPVSEADVTITNTPPGGNPSTRVGRTNIQGIFEASFPAGAQHGTGTVLATFRRADERIFSSTPPRLEYEAGDRTTNAEIQLDARRRNLPDGESEPVLLTLSAPGEGFTPIPNAYVQLTLEDRQETDTDSQIQFEGFVGRTLGAMTDADGHIRFTFISGAIAGRSIVTATYMQPSTDPSGTPQPLTQPTRDRWRFADGRSRSPHQRQRNDYGRASDGCRDQVRCRGHQCSQQWVCHLALRRTFTPPGLLR